MMIVIDMDEVIANAHQQFLESYERDFDINITQTVAGWKSAPGSIPQHKPVVPCYVHRKYFCQPSLIEGSKEVIKK